MHGTATDVIETVIEALFPRGIDEASRAEVERSLGRVFVQDHLDASDLDLGEIAERVMADELGNLPEDVIDALYSKIVEGVTERLEEMIREECRSFLRDISRKVTT